MTAGDSGVSYSGSIDFDWQDIYSHIPGFCDDLSDIESVRKIVEENTHEYAVAGFAMKDDPSGRPTYVYLIDDARQLGWVLQRFCVLCGPHPGLTFQAWLPVGRYHSWW